MIKIKHFCNLLFFLAVTSIMFSQQNQVDSDGDGIIDKKDLDDDNDGILDKIENKKSKQDITSWSNRVNVSPSSNTIVFRSGNAGWANTINSTSFSSLDFNENYKVTFRAKGSAKSVIGFGIEESSDHYDDVDFGIYFKGKRFRVISLGDEVTMWRNFKKKDVFTLVYRNNKIKILQNGTQIHVFKKVGRDLDLYVDTSFEGYESENECRERRGREDRIRRNRRQREDRDRRERREREDREIKERRESDKLNTNSNRNQNSRRIGRRNTMQQFSAQPRMSKNSLQTKGLQENWEQEDRERRERREREDRERRERREREDRVRRERRKREDRDRDKNENEQRLAIFSDFVIKSVGKLDTDRDGIINSLDLDADGDGCFDVQEAGFDDPDNDGILGDGIPKVDNKGRVVGTNGYHEITNDFLDPNVLACQIQTDHGVWVNTAQLPKTRYEVTHLDTKITELESGNLNSEVFVDLGNNDGQPKTVEILVKGSTTSQALKLKFSVLDTSIFDVQVFNNNVWLDLSTEFYKAEAGKITFLNKQVNPTPTFKMNLINGVQYNPATPLTVEVQNEINLTNAHFEIIPPYGQRILLQPSTVMHGFILDKPLTRSGSYQFKITIQGKVFKGHFLYALSDEG